MFNKETMILLVLGMLGVYTFVIFFLPKFINNRATRKNARECEEDEFYDLGNFHALLQNKITQEESDIYDLKNKFSLNPGSGVSAHNLKLGVKPLTPERISFFVS